ncbi:hypothetical protein GCM10020358_23410 [Amorphoplanes nipponensis]|uniref:Uncharacterized protein n=1 Tax=Actinoplanes nipponensis TaxID=135950 RepID=A0A919JPY6_9ACTN|nr:hypothetical protein [Actinoplanes nipponensis]GIE53176.1 hypothetical protein Ani05nite_67100 [Actinoplanes nipponensis]
MSEEQQRPTLGRRAGTRRGLAARLPDGAYEPAPLLQNTPAGMEVTMVGEDGRRAVFRFTKVPLPQWHPVLAAALSRCTGPQGTLRTPASARAVWQGMRQLLTFLDDLPQPPQTPDTLTARHLQRFWLTRSAVVARPTLVQEVAQLRALFRQIDPPDLIHDDVRAWLAQRRPKGPTEPPSGYSDQEFEAIMAAARSDVVAIRQRLDSGRRLLARFARNPDSLDIEQQKLAAVLTEIAATGDVPVIRMPPPNTGLRDRAAMLALAQHLFVIDADLGPLLTLAVGLSGRNPETIKDLRAEHEILENKAVRAELIKRRRGPGHTFATAHWEIGSPSQQLRTPGGFYLLLEQLMRLGRSFSGTASLWSIWVWRNGHIGPFDRSRGLSGSFDSWKKGLGLRDDDGYPLRVSLPLLKKTVDVRTTRATGGHLPSSPRSNGMPVLFSNYLRGDASVREWAGDVVTAALADAERDARESHARVLAAATPAEPRAVAAQLGLTEQAAQDLLDGRLDTAFAACADIERSPFNGGQRCSASFLLCFGCENALVTHAHLPRLKAVLDWLVEQREKLDLALWWQRHGLTWLAITEHIRPRFSPAEWDQASTATGLARLLAVLDGPQEPA